MGFSYGMQCCNPYREQAGLSCDYGNQLCCASSAIERMANGMPSGVPRLINTLLDTFPASVGYVIQHALRYADPAVAIDVAAKYCATLPARADRLAFKDQIAGYLNGEQLEQFEKTTVAEFQRRKTSTNRG
ncbi:hypothetical protein [Burkholderia cepacia]|uniref:hypothetical protein n=1 Tax=Burkholderia cepacia TaxID=292 RepID=UPI000755B467|nr:hypothetical protein [Burkholderia cepacia]KWC82750.1 hypothetical protein WL58_17925 [Burkholderia cepacia]KWH57869.1 hypothetical protein WM00_10305 [Burkholderia cepacia]